MGGGCNRKDLTKAIEYLGLGEGRGGRTAEKTNIIPNQLRQDFAAID